MQTPNWPKLVSDILEKGRMSQSALAGMLGKSQAWISSVTLGHFDDLKWTEGEAIRKAHRKYCSKSGRKSS